MYHLQCTIRPCGRGLILAQRNQIVHNKDVRLDDLRCTIENAMPARKSNYRNRKTKQTSIVHRK